MCRQRRPLSTANKTFVCIGQRPTWPKCPGSQLLLIDSAVYSSGAVHLYTSSFSQTKTASQTHCTCRTGHTYLVWGDGMSSMEQVWWETCLNPHYHGNTTRMYAPAPVIVRVCLWYSMYFGCKVSLLHFHCERPLCVAHCTVGSVSSQCKYYWFHCDRTEL